MLTESLPSTVLQLFVSMPEYIENYTLECRCLEVFCIKGVLKNLFLIFIRLKSHGKPCLKLENAWFLLVHGVTKNNTD